LVVDFIDIKYAILVSDANNRFLQPQKESYVYISKFATAN